MTGWKGLADEVGMGISLAQNQEDSVQLLSKFLLLPPDSSRYPFFLGPEPANPRIRTTLLACLQLVDDRTWDLSASIIT